MYFYQSFGQVTDLHALWTYEKYQLDQEATYTKAVCMSLPPQNNRTCVT